MDFREYVVNKLLITCDHKIKKYPKYVESFKANNPDKEPLSLDEYLFPVTCLKWQRKEMNCKPIISFESYTNPKDYFSQFDNDELWYILDQDFFEQYH